MSRSQVGPYRAHARDLGAKRLSVLCFAGGAPRFSWNLLAALAFAAIALMVLAVKGNRGSGDGSGSVGLVVTAFTVALGTLVALLERARLVRSDADGVTVRSFFKSWRAHAADAAGSRLLLLTDAGTMSLGVPSIRPGDEHEAVARVTTAVREHLSPPPVDAVASLPRAKARAQGAVPSGNWPWQVAAAVSAVWVVAFMATDDGNRGAWFSLGVPLYESALLRGAPLQRFPGLEGLSALWLIAGGAGAFAIVGAGLSRLGPTPPLSGRFLRIVVFETGPRDAPGREPMVGVLRGIVVYSLIGLPLLTFVNFLVRDGSLGGLTPILYLVLPANLVLLPLLAGWFLMEVIRAAAAVRAIALDGSGVWLHVDGERLRLTDAACDGPSIALRAGELVVHVRLPSLMPADGVGEHSHEAVVALLLSRLGTAAQPS